MSSIEQQVKGIVAEQLGVKEDEVTNSASFVDDLGADSLDTVELVMALEEEFETEIPDEDAEKITTVQQAIDFVTALALQAKTKSYGTVSSTPLDTVPDSPNFSLAVLPRQTDTH